MTSTMSNSTTCQDFVQNAWKKDLCSNCFRTRADHLNCGIIADSQSPTDDRDAHQFHNGFGKRKMKPNKNHVTGVQLWEIGSSGSVKVQLSSSDYRATNVGDVKGILKDKQKVLKTLENNNSNGSDSNVNGRRSSVVGFADNMPLVIGYGGGDYEWGEDEDSSDDPSDVDSLENYDLSLEEKAFTELTDTNTQYNAENLSILQLESHQNRSTVTNGSEKVVSVLKSNSQTPPHSISPSPSTTPASTPSPTVLDKDFNSINEARNFICSNLYGASEDVETTLNDAESEIIIRRENELAKVLIKAGCDTAPSSTGRRHVVRPSVKDYFTKEEPVTAADFAAVAEKCHSTITRIGTNGVCSPYGIVSITSVNSNMDVPPSDPPPSVPNTPPTDNVNTNEKRSLICSNKGEFEENTETVEELRANRENVVRSCHYASANVSNGVATPPLISGTKSDPSSRQQTPLTSPYSSTAILKGIPSSMNEDDFSNKTKPPVLKPKPKIPVKPNLVTPPTSPEPPPSKQDTTVAGSDSPSADSPSIGIQNRDPSFEMNKNSGQGSINLGKRPSKRPAPRPPTDLPLLLNNNAAMSAEEAKITSPVDEQFEQFEGKMSVAGSVDDVSNSYEITSPTSVKSLSSVSSPVLQEDSVPYGVPTPISPNSTMNNSPTFQDHSKDVNIKVKKSKFSLKKLLKFGSAKEDHHFEQRRLKSERRSKLEIIHPIDLIQSSRTDLTNISTLPSSPDSPYGTNGSSSDRPVLTKMTTFSSPPVSPGWSSTATSENGAQVIASSTENAQSQELANTSGSILEVETQANVCSNLKNKDAELAINNIKISENGNKSNKEPKPPPRSRYIDVQHNNSANKDKPVRPPPPIKVQESNESNGAEEQKKENQVEIEEDEELANEKDKNLNGFMDYANLGDIRTSLAPRKPGRWPSGTITELSEDTNAQNNDEDHYDHVKTTPQSTKTQTSGVTYYAPPLELEDLSQEELYADQAAVLPSSDGHSSLTSNSTSSSQSTDVYNNEINSKSSKMEASNGGKIYERVVLKRNGLEKVYSSSPTALSSIESSNGCGQMYESDEMSDISSLWPRRVSSRLSLRKIKTVVHKNLEDNYGAVVAANHQTLTQISEQVALTHHVKATKAKILENVNLNWMDFQLLEDSQVTVVGQKAFYSAVWKQQNLETTLMVTRENVCSPTQPIRNPCVLAPLAEFQSAIPGAYFAESDKSNISFDNQGTVWVMDRMRVETIFNMAENLQIQRENDPETCEREVSFILLQLINGLKHLQMLGIEEIEADLSDFLLVMSNNEVNHRLVILPKSSTVMDAYQSPPTSTQEKFSLGQGALEVMRLLFQEPSVDTLISLNDGFGLIAEILNQEKADSLSQAKRLLEYLLWGPTNLNSLDSRMPENNKVVPITDQEQTFQRWLDLERANVLNNLIRTQSLWQIRLTIFEEYMLSFFVRTSAKLLRESSNQLQTNTKKFT